ncbi:MAG: hypothetical protein A2W03_04230 [Candidatus Aminicenantes bacterium RBG_16_63_16]|nr:MAG: hypothetical protein A2W03_04230 [Candidatus Aminicenantes bacterium RBG_16_63_16]
MSQNLWPRRLLTMVASLWLMAAAVPPTAQGNGPLRIGLLNVDGHAWWFGGFFNPYDEARLEKNFPRAAERNRLIRGVILPIPNARIVKVWGQDPKAAREFAATYDNPEVVEKPEDLLGGIDAVMLVNAGGDGSNHLDLIRPFLERGLPAYIDKPMAFTGKQAREIVDLAQRHTAPVYSTSVLPYVAELSWLYRKEKLGKINYVLSQGGTLIHGILTNYAGLGPGIVSVRNIGDEKRDLVQLLKGDGAMGLILIAPDIRDSLGAYFSVGLIGENDKIDPEPIRPNHYQYGAAVAMLNFLEMVRTGKPPVPYDQLVEQIEIYEAARLSKARGGAAVLLTELR